MLPVALSESVLDYRVLEERVGEDGVKSRRVLLVVAPRDQVEPYTRMANLAGIRLEALDLEALGLLRAFVAPGTGARTTRRHGVRCRLDRTRVVDAPRCRRRGVRVHPRLRLGRKRARGSSRLLARRPAGRSGNDSPAPVPLGPGPAVRDPRRGEAGAGNRCRPSASHPVRTGARQLAPVLPDPGRVARHRRDPDHRRHVASRGHRRRAPSDDRRQRLGRRSALAGDPRGGLRSRPRVGDRLARRADRARDRRHVDAGRQPAAEGHRHQEVPALDAGRDRRACRRRRPARRARASSTSERTARSSISRASSTRPRPISPLCRCRRRR